MKDKRTPELFLFIFALIPQQTYLSPLPNHHRIRDIPDVTYVKTN